MDMPKFMDMPIYLRFLDLEPVECGASRPLNPGPQYRWFVIEERGDQETTADELGAEHWIHKSPDDRVRDLNLPHLNYDVDDAAFLVYESRLFFVGGNTYREEEDIVEPNGILYIDLQQPSDLSWKRCEKWGENISFVHGAVVFEARHSILAVLPDRMLCFDCRNVEAGKFIHTFRAKARILLAWTGHNMILYKPGVSRDISMDPDDNSLSQLFSFNPRTGSWGCTNFLEDPPSARWCYMPSPFYSTVVVREFLICFADVCPMKEEYFPALYVYDMFNSKWLSQPVQGLPNDGIILPSLTTQRPIFHASLMRVRRDVLKLALVWSIVVDDDEDGSVNDQTEIHWSKFILHSQGEEKSKFILNIQGEEKDRTLCAEILSSGTCYGGHTLLINCTAG